MLSLRVSNHRTGRPNRRASHGHSSSSGYGKPLAPKPPPTSGVTTRTCSAARPYTSASRSRTGCAPCELAQWWRRPSSAHSETATLTSRGQGATFELLILARTTTSHPEKSRPSPGISKHTFVPASGNSSTSPANASSGSTTTGSGS